VISSGNVGDALDYKTFYTEQEQKQYDKKTIVSSIILIVMAAVLVAATLLAIKFDSGPLFLIALMIFVAFCVTFFVFGKDMLMINQEVRKDYKNFQTEYQKIEENINFHNTNQSKVINSLSNTAIQNKIDENNNTIDENNRLLDKLIPGIATEENIIKFGNYKNLLYYITQETPTLDSDRLKQILWDALVLQSRQKELELRTDMQFNRFWIFLEIFWQLFPRRMGPQIIRNNGLIFVQGIVIDLKQEVVISPLSHLSFNALGEKFGTYNLKTKIGPKIGMSYVVNEAVNNLFAKNYIIISNSHGEFIIFVLKPGNQFKIETILITHLTSSDKPGIFYEYEAVGQQFLLKQQGNVAEIFKRFPIEITTEQNTNKLKLILTDLELIHQIKDGKTEILAN
jgi:ABC-type multidrug transport system fused ATPase/permease subunit